MHGDAGRSTERSTECSTEQKMTATSPVPLSAPAEEDAKAAKAEAQTFLSSLLNKKLRVHTTDERMFWGEFKCTDPDRNVVLQYTYEYRQPSLQQRAKAAQHAEGGGTVALDMIHRYLGLVVVPGKHIVKIETEDFESQLR